MRLRTLIPTAAVAAVAVALPATASADAMLVDTPDNSQNLTAGGGYLAWAQPNQPAGSGWRIVMRAPNGSVTTPDIPPFEDVPQPSLGTGGLGDRGLRIVYARAGDIYEYVIASRRERRTSIRPAGVERSPSVVFGTYAFVRVSGGQTGIYVMRNRRARRVSAEVPQELAFNGSRVAYPLGNSVFIKRTSGRGTTFRINNSARPESLVMDRYKVSWLVGDDVFQTPRFGGSGPKRTVSTANRGTRPLAGANSVAMSRGRVAFMLDAEGVKRLDPRPFGSRG